MDHYEIAKLYESFETTGVYRAEKLPKSYRKGASGWMRKTYMFSGITLTTSATSAQFTVIYPRYMFDLEANPEIIDGWNIHKYYSVTTNEGKHIILSFYKPIKGTPGYAMRQAQEMRKDVIESFKIFKPRNYNWRTKTKPILKHEE